MGYTLYSAWRATAPYRVRIGLALKDVPYDYAALDLIKGEQREPAYQAVNRQKLTPALDLGGGRVLTQTVGGQTTSYTYDVDGRQACVAQPGGSCPSGGSGGSGDYTTTSYYPSGLVYQQRAAEERAAQDSAVREKLLREQQEAAQLGTQGRLKKIVKERPRADLTDLLNDKQA